jgi:hypothetical protein
MMQDKKLQRTESEDKMLDTQKTVISYRLSVIGEEGCRLQDTGKTGDR